MSDDSIDVTWEDPPEHALGLRKKTPYTAFARALRENPGKWALAPGVRKSPESARNTGQNLSRGTMRDFPKGEFETAVDGTKLYVRYLGPKGAPPAGAARVEAPDEVVLGDSHYKASTIRAWARTNGFDIGDRGVLPNHIIAAFEEAHEARGEGEEDEDS